MHMYMCMCMCMYVNKKTYMDHLERPVGLAPLAGQWFEPREAYVSERVDRVLLAVEAHLQSK